MATAFEVSLARKAPQGVGQGCGSPLLFERHTRSLMVVTVGSHHEPHGFKPQIHLCMESVTAWLDIRDDAPRHARKPEGMTPLVEYDPVTGRTRD